MQTKLYGIVEMVNCTIICYNNAVEFFSTETHKHWKQDFNKVLEFIRVKFIIQNTIVVIIATVLTWEIYTLIIPCRFLLSNPITPNTASIFSHAICIPHIFTSSTNKHQHSWIVKNLHLHCKHFP